MNPIGLATEGGWVKDRKSVLNTRFMLDFNVPGLEGLNLKVFSPTTKYSIVSKDGLLR